MNWRKIKHFFGYFNLTPFEAELLGFLKKNLADQWASVLDSQLGRFNQTDRVLESGDDLPFGHTSFYWSRFGKVRTDYPERFPMKEDSEDLATCEVYSPQDENLINVTFVLAHGYLFSIKYRSDKKVLVPKPGYQIRNFRLLKEELAR